MGGGDWLEPQQQAIKIINEMPEVASNNNDLMLVIASLIGAIATIIAAWIGVKRRNKL